MYEDLLIPIFGIVGTFGWLIVWVYMFYSSRVKIRMALIESGKDASIFATGYRKAEALKYGILGVMAGAGILLGELLENLGLPGVVAYFSMILIMGGLGLVGFYIYLSKKGEQEEALI